jgi:hypothetical protein
MIIDERFIDWLKGQNISEHIGDKVVKKSLYKWYGFISERVPNMNKKKMSNYQYLCVFVEFYQRWIDTLSRAEKKNVRQVTTILENLNKNISNQNQSRSKVVNEWFNYETGTFEYELEDGNLILSDKKSSGNFLAPDLVDTIFSSIYHRIVNPDLFREEQINKILN